jgi:hypothetical protein
MRRPGRVTVVALLAVGLAACSSSDGTGCDDGGSCSSLPADASSAAIEPWAKDLSAASEQWAARRIQSYELRVDKYSADAGFRCTFKVIAGNATLIGGAESTDGATDTTLSRDLCQSVPNTVEALYDEVRQVLSSNSKDNVVEYDPYGAPKSIGAKDPAIDAGRLRVVVTP